MRRLVAIAALLGLCATFAILGSGAGDGDAYLVRTEFRNAFSVIPGEDVKIAGVKVGSIDDLDVTDRNTASVVLRIDTPGFQDFREDATCIIRPQSLIGEKFVECTPTQPRAQGAPEAGPLEKIEDGEGEGQHVLPGLQASPLEHQLDAIGGQRLRPADRQPHLGQPTALVTVAGAQVAADGSGGLGP